MAEAFAGWRLTDTVVAALRLASSNRRFGGRLQTHALLLALQSVDQVGGWERFVIREQAVPDSERESTGTWEGVPLSAECAEAFVRARSITEAYGLDPMPVGVLALALVWDEMSGAALSFMGLSSDDLIEQIQSNILGTSLEGLPELLACSASSYDGPVARGPRIGPRGAAAAPSVMETSTRLTEAERGLASVTSRLPASMFRLLVVAALIGVALGLLTNPYWTFRPKDDLAPPLRTPAIAGAIPLDAAASHLMGTELLRTEDGLPNIHGYRLYDSMLPLPYDIRTQTVHDAWEAYWMATDGRTHVVVQLARPRLAGQPAKGIFVGTCAASSGASASPLVTQAGYVQHTKRAAEYCSYGFDKQTCIYVAVLTADPAVMQGLPIRVATFNRAIVSALPEPDFSLVDRVSTPYATARINRSLAFAVIGLPLFWALPTLLLDRATWQRLAWILSLRRFRSLPLPGLDIDPFVRDRLWASATLACVQVLTAVWVLRLTSHWGIYATAVAVIGSVLALSAVSRWLYLRRRGRAAVFAGRRRVLLLIGAAFAGTGVLFGLVVAFIADSSATTGVRGTSVPDYAWQRLQVLYELLALLAALLALAPMMFARRLAMRSLRKRDPGTDQGPPILLLRSFADDGRRLRARSSHRRALADRLTLRRWERFEEVVAASLGVEGPIYAVGQIGERLPPPLGAVRRQFTNEEWQGRVFELMADSAVICVTVGRSTSLEWEIGRIWESGFLSKTIFVLPPTSRREHRKRLAVLAAALDLRWADLAVELAGGWALTVRMRGRGERPEVIRARAQEDVAYDIALELCRAAIAGLALPLEYLPSDIALPVPRKEIFPLGRGPVFKPLLRRRWVRVALALNASGLITLVATFVSAEKQDASGTISLDSGYSATAVASDPRTSQSYCTILNGSGLVRLDFDNRSGTSICRIEFADQLEVDGGWAFTANGTAGTLQGIDLAERRIAWTRSDVQGIRGLVLTGSRLSFVLPAQRRVISADLKTGRTLASRKLDGIPWSSASTGPKLWVSLADKSSLVNLDATTLANPQVVHVGSDPTQVAAAAGTVWTYLAARRELVAVSGPLRGHLNYTRSSLPHIASNGSVLAIEGVEQISSLWPDGALRRNRLWSRHAEGLAVTATGDVVTTSDYEITVIRASEP